MTGSLKRRRFVQVGASALAGGFAGCLDDGNGDESSDDTDDEGDDTADADESESVGSDGLLYAFAPDRIGIIDPDEGAVVDEITEGVSGVAWGDPRITHDHGTIFVPDSDRARLAAIDTETRTLDEWIDVGPDPLHNYEPVDGEIWVHSDDEGSFYVVDVESYEVLETVEIVPDGGHGKLLTHEELGDRAYAVNVSEPMVATVDLGERERTGTIDLGDVGGTHYKAYAPATSYAYFEHQGVGTAVVDTASDEVIDALDIEGGMSLSPDEELLAVLDGETVRFLDATDEASDVVDTVEIDAEPDALRYHDASDGLYAFTANAAEPGVSVIDLDEMAVTETFEIGAVEGWSRTAVAGGGYVFASSDAEGTVVVVDGDDLERTAEVEVGEGVDRLQYIGDSGVGYTGR